MLKVRFILEGSNFLMPFTNGVKRVGFFWAREVEAEDMVSARFLALEEALYLLTSEALILNQEGDDYGLTTTRSYELAPEDRLKKYFPFVFFTAKSDEQTTEPPQGRLSRAFLDSEVYFARRLAVMISDHIRDLGTMPLNITDLRKNEIYESFKEERGDKRVAIATANGPLTSEVVIKSLSSAKIYRYDYEELQRMGC